MEYLDTIEAWHVTVKFCGPTNHHSARFRVSWHNNIGNNKTFRYMEYNYSKNRVANDAAKMFTDWLTDTSSYLVTPKTISIGSLSTDSYSVHITTTINNKDE